MLASDASDASGLGKAVCAPRSCPQQVSADLEVAAKAVEALAKAKVRLDRGAETKTGDWEAAVPQEPF